MKMRSYNFCHTNTKNPGNNLGIFCLITGRPKLNGYEYVNCCVGAFANRFKLTLAQSYAYLRRFKGIDFLIDCYAAEHTLSIEDAVEDIMLLCQKNGGRVGC